MKIKILPSAIKDLHEGRLFYERQGEELGEYFFDTLFSDIDSLTLLPEKHSKVFGYHRLLSKRFPFRLPNSNFAITPHILNKVLRTRIWNIHIEKTSEPIECTCNR